MINWSKVGHAVWTWLDTKINDGNAIDAFMLVFAFIGMWAVIDLILSMLQCVLGM